MKKPIRLIFCIIILLVLCPYLAACTAGDEASEVSAVATDIRVGALKGPTGMAMAALMARSDAGNCTHNYRFTIAGAPDQIVGQLVTGELDIAAVPANSAAILYNKTAGQVRAAAVSTLGVLYVLEKGDTIQTVSDLNGKSLVSAGRGTSAEYVLNYILHPEGGTLEPDVRVDYKSEHTEVAALAATGACEVVLLPEPFVTALLNNDAGFRIALDLTAEWEELGAGPLTMGVIAVRSEFAAQHPEALTAFIEEYSAAVTATNQTPAAAAQSIEHYDIMPAAVAATAIPRANIVCLTGEAMQDGLSSYLNVLYTADPASVGGALPGDDFYWY